MIDRGLALNQNLAVGWAYRGAISVYFGQHGAAIEQLTRSFRLNPLDPGSHWSEVHMAYAHLSEGRYDESLRWTSKALADRPDYAAAFCPAAIATALGRNIDQAGSFMLQMRRSYPEMRISNLADYLVARRPEDMARMTEGLRLAGLPE